MLSYSKLVSNSTPLLRYCVIVNCYKIADYIKILSVIVFLTQLSDVTTLN